MPRVNVSFRKTSRDMQLYLEIEKKEPSEKSEFVKDAIEFYLEYLKKEGKK